MKKNFFATLLILLSFSLYGDEEIAYITENCAPPSRRDNIPIESVSCADDDYLTGYIQALVDMNYWEFRIQVVVQNQVAYVYHLPRNELVAQSILCFIADIPGICNVQRVCSDPCNTFCWPTPCASPCEIGGIWFPQTTVLFAPLIADPRQVTNSAALRFNDNAIGKHVGAVSFGDQFIFFRWRDVGWWHGELECGIEAGIFSVFDLDHPKACMVNTDFFVAALFDYAVDRWSWRFRLWHLSSHVGDEFLLSNPGFNRCNLSDEGVDLFASYQLCRSIRLYAGFGDIFSRDKEFPEKPYYFEWGTEIRILGERDCFNKLYIQPFLAMNFSTWQEHEWSIDQTYALGVEWSRLQGVGRKVRFFIEYHNGFSEEGQFLRKRTEYAAVRLTYGF